MTSKAYQTAVGQATTLLTKLGLVIETQYRDYIPVTILNLHPQLICGSMPGFTIPSGFVQIFIKSGFVYWTSSDDYYRLMMRIHTDDDFRAEEYPLFPATPARSRQLVSV